MLSMFRSSSKRLPSSALLLDASTQAAKTFSSPTGTTDELASSSAWSEEWKKLGMGAKKANIARDELNRLMFVRAHNITNRNSRRNSRFRQQVGSVADSQYAADVRLLYVTQRCRFRQGLDATNTAIAAGVAPLTLVRDIPEAARMRGQLPYPPPPTCSYALGSSATWTQIKHSGASYINTHLHFSPEKCAAVRACRNAIEFNSIPGNA